MTIGYIFTWIAFLASLVAAYFYFIEEKNRSKKKTGRQWYRIVVLFGILTSAVLFYGLLTHQFEYRYVASYSSNSLPLLYLISSFWAGQEGTFLLWAVLVGVIGLAFPHKDGKGLNVVLQAFPLDGKVVLREPSEDDQEQPGDKGGETRARRSGSR